MARTRSAKLYQTLSIPGNRSTIQMNKKVILRVQYFRKYLFKIATNLNLKPELEICPPRSGGWRVSRRRGRVFSYLRVSRRRGRVFSYWRVSRRRGRVFSYFAAYVLGLVLGLVCQSAISFLPFRIFWRSHPRRGLVFLQKKKENKKKA